MRVVPPDDPLVRKILVLDFVDVFPRVLREGNVSSRLCRVEPRYPRGDAQSVSKLFANQYAADFGFAVGARVLPDLAKHLAFDGHSRLPLVWFAFTHGDCSVKARLPGPRTCRPLSGMRAPHPPSAR